MSHIDEGLLHAYLDGALEDYPPGTARRVRAHLERCAPCAETLDDARRLRDETEVILALPEIDTSLPPLEELRRRARTSEVSPGPARIRLHRLYRMGWAASVVLALGAGWSLRGDRGGGPAFEVAEPSVSEPTSADVSADRAATAGSGATEAVPAGRGREVGQDLARRSEEPREGAGPVPSARDAEAPVPDGGAETRVAVSVPTPPVAVVAEAASDDREAVASLEALAPLEPGPAPALPVPTDAGSFVAAASGIAGASDLPPAEAAPTSTAGLANAADRTERTRAAETPMALAARADAAPPGLAGGGRIAGGYDAAAGDDADRKARDPSDPGSLVVPGLDVVSIVWREEGVTPAGVRVLQRMEDGGTLELIHLPEGVEPSSVAPAEAGVRELVVPREQGWVILRAAVEEAVLVDLLRRLDEPTEP